MHIKTLRLTTHEANYVQEKDIIKTLRDHVYAAETQNRHADERIELWLDVIDATPEEWEAILESLDMQENDRDVSMETQNFPQAEALTGGGVALRLPTRNFWQDESSTYMNVVLLKHTLLTQHCCELSPLDKVRRHLLEGDRPDIADMPGLLLYVIQGLMEAGVSDLLQARARVESLEDSLEARPEHVNVSDVRLMKHDIEHLTGQTEEQLFCLTMMRGLLPSAPELMTIHTPTGELLDALNHLQRSFQRLETRLSGFLAQLDSRLRDRTDQRLRILTIFSAIFMPLTFITGLYGMNFETMPALHSPWGYYVVAGIMVSVSLGMVFFFWRKGWFK